MKCSNVSPKQLSSQYLKKIPNTCRALCTGAYDLSVKKKLNDVGICTLKTVDFGFNPYTLSG